MEQPHTRMESRTCMGLFLYMYGTGALFSCSEVDSVTGKSGIRRNDEPTFPFVIWPDTYGHSCVVWPYVSGQLKKNQTRTSTLTSCNHTRLVCCKVTIHVQRYLCRITIYVWSADKWPNTYEHKCVVWLYVSGELFNDQMRTRLLTQLANFANTHTGK